MRDTCLNCGNKIEGEPFDMFYCSEECKVSYKASIFRFPDYQKGYYSAVICNELHVPLTSSELIYKELICEDRNFIFVIEEELERFVRYVAIRKTWTVIETYDNQEGLIKKKMPKYNSILFDYFKPEGFIIFHSEIHKVKPIIRHLVYAHKSKIVIPRNIDLKIFLAKLNESGIRYILREGRIVNFELKFGTIGNFHFKSIVKEDLDDMIRQQSTYFSSMKFRVEGIEENCKIELYLNGSFYLFRSNSTLFDILTIYINLMRVEHLSIV